MTLVFTKVKDKIIHAFSFLKNGNSLFYYFIFLLLVGVVFFATSLFNNEFTTPFTGDYNTQQYAFYLNTYDDWWHFIRTGSFRLFDTNTYLGVNNIGSNSFYSLFDPFFFIVMIFPRTFMGQAMAISTIFRMSMSGFVFYGYLRYMNIKDKSARFAGLAYAYCGWTVWYLWFNCYTENALVFVLILWGVEKIIREKKPWILMASLFLGGLTNYFFLVCFVMMGFIYAMFRFFQRIKSNSAKNNLLILGVGFIGFAAGILMSSVIVLPSIMVALEAPRATSSSYLDSLINFFKHGDIKQLFSYIFDWGKADDHRSYRAYFPLIDFFFPVMSNRGTPLTRFQNETYDNVAGSIFSYYPFLILFLPAIIRSVKNKKWSHLIAIVFFVVSLVTPFFYYLFFGFTKPYSRWTLFVTTSFLTYTAEYLDHVNEEPKWNIIVGSIFTIAGVLISGYIASKVVKDITEMNERFFNGSISISVIVAIIYISILTITWYIFKNHKHMNKILFGFIVIEVGVMGFLTIEGHGTTYYPLVNYGYTKNTVLAEVVSKVNKDDSSYFRAMSSIAADSNKNDGARNGYNGVSFFHSVYNFNVKNFTYWSMIMTSKSGWSGRYIEKRIGLDTFLGIKYYFEEKDRYQYGDVNVPIGFEDVSEQYPNNSFYVYKNTNHIDFAFTYDSVYPYPSDETASNPLEYGATSPQLALRNDFLYLSGAILNDVDTAKVLNDNPDLNVREISSLLLPYNISRIYSKTSSASSSWESHVYDLEQVVKKMNPNDIVKEIDNRTPLVNRPDKNTGLKHVIVITPKAGYENSGYDEYGMIFYLTCNFRTNQKVDVYLVDYDNNIITFDNHNDDRVGNENSTRRGPRGFYVAPHNGEPAKKVKEIIIAPRWGEFNTSEDVYYQSYSSYKNNILSKLQEYPVTDINYRDNHFDFKTNFEKRRFIVTQVAYDKGWSVKATLPDGTKKNIDTYLSHGGFVGFMSEAGDTSYSMDYYTPYLKGGILLSAIGTFVFISTLMGYIYLDYRNKEKRLNYILSLKEAI